MNQSAFRLYSHKRGFSLVELIVAVGIFALVMVLASGSYLMMIGITEQAQAITSGVDNLSFALETMTRTIRTGINYSCNGIGDCVDDTGSSFSLRNEEGDSVTYRLENGTITQTVGNNNVKTSLTDPSRVTVKSMTFSAYGTPSRSFDPSNVEQARVVAKITGEVKTNKGTRSVQVNLQTSATMRGIDL